MELIKQFSEEQDAVRYLETDGTFLISGPPGTGKSLLAALRVSRLYVQSEEMDPSVILITKYRLLEQHIMQGLAPALRQIDPDAALALSGERVVQSYNSWAHKWQRQARDLIKKKSGAYPKEFPKVSLDQWADYDWKKVYTLLDANELVGSAEILPQHIVIDEGQDLSPDFYWFLAAMDANVTVFADENQRMSKVNSTLAEIRDALGITTADVGHELKVTKNFRGTRPMAKFSAEFYANLETGIPTLPERAGPLPEFVGFGSIEGLAKQILKLAQAPAGSESAPSVGVIVFDARNRKKFSHLLDQVARDENSLQTRDIVDVRTYSYEDRAEYLASPWPPDEPGTVTVLNVQTIKGLEWDHVILYVDGYKAEVGDPLHMSQMYIATSRGRLTLRVVWVASGAMANNVPGAHLPELFSRFCFNDKLQPLIKRYYTQEVLNRMKEVE